MSVQKQIEKTLKASIGSRIQLERTSVAGEGSTLVRPQGRELQRQLHIKRLRMDAERDRVTEMFRR